ncbi:MAG: tryptophan synthase subunit alpha, partial [Gemmatimonadales bacterium]
MSESRLAPAWAALKSQGRTALIPYLTAGYPSPGASAEALRAADEMCDILEVGVPFSDPLADGPTIQRSTFEALRRGMTLGGTLELIAGARLTRPVVVFSYFNPIFHYGVDRFLAEAEALGIAGLLLTDLPAGSDPGVESAVQASGLDLIRLIAPTTRPERLAGAVAGAQGFVYLIARLGVTGASASLASELSES